MNPRPAHRSVRKSGPRSLVAGLLLSAAWLAPLASPLLAQRASDAPPARSSSPTADPAALAAAAEQALRSGRVHEAVELAERAVAAVPDRAKVRILLGQAQLAANRPGDAVTSLARAASLRPSDPLVAFLHGFALFQSGRWYEAAEALERAEQLEPRNPNPGVYRGLALLELGQPVEARRLLETAAKSLPDDANVKRGLARLALAEGDAATAEAIARQSLEANTNPETADDLDTVLLLGRALLAQGRAQEAAERLAESARDSHFERSDLLYLRSQALLRSGQRAEGRAVLERFREREAREERIRLLAASGSLTAAQHAEWVELLLAVGRADEAAARLRAALREHSSDPRLRALVLQVQNARAP